MNLGAIVEVAIGMIFVWIVLSLTTIQFQEWLTTSRQKRAKDLERAIRRMLANPNLKDQFYDHPIIRGITPERNKNKKPPYIPAQQFALSLFDMVMTAGTESSLIQQGLYSVRNELEQAKKKDKNEAAIVALDALIGLSRELAATEAGTAITKAGLNELNDRVEELKNQVRDFSSRYNFPPDKIEKILQDAEKYKSKIEQILGPKNSKDPALVQLRHGISALGTISPELNQTLTALLNNVEDYVTKDETQLGLARKNVEKWFDDSMEGLNGTFKRYAQFWSLIIGFIVASLLNVDSINLTIYLWREPSVRQVLVQKASEFDLPEGIQSDRKCNPESDPSCNPTNGMQEFREQFVGLSLPIGWVLNETKSKGSAYSDVECRLLPKDGEAFGIPVPALILQGLPPLPIRYHSSQGETFKIADTFTNKCLAPPQSDDETNIFLKFFGIFITALAARQGAPFWFDILKKAVNLRGTGANPVEKDAAK